MRKGRRKTDAEDPHKEDVLFYHALKKATKLMNLEIGDVVVMTGGKPDRVSGNTDMIKIETISKTYED